MLSVVTFTQDQGNADMAPTTRLCPYLLAIQGPAGTLLSCKWTCGSGIPCSCLATVVTQGWTDVFQPQWLYVCLVILLHPRVSTTCQTRAERWSGGAGGRSIWGPTGRVVPLLLGLLAAH